MNTVVVVDDDRAVLRSVHQLLQADDLKVVPVDDPRAALKAIENERADLVLLDLRMPGLSGLDLLKQIRAGDAKLPVIVVTAHVTATSAVEAAKLGIFDFVAKPFEARGLKELCHRALAERHLMTAGVALDATEPDTGAEALVGRSAPMRELYKQIGQAVQVEVPVLVAGESGTGKELITRAIYTHGRRVSRPFLAVNCAALPDTLLENELFGHEQGAFTGAGPRSVGKLERCHTGTVFLDEIGDASPALQAKMLRFLQDGSLVRLGGHQAISVDVRVICATNRNLEEEVSAGSFREDLFYRLSVLTIRAPPLRERREDIPLLARYLLCRFARQMAAEATGISDGAIAALMEHPWPGNVRELENVLQRAVLRCRGKSIVPEDLGVAREATAPTRAAPLGELDACLAKICPRLLDLPPDQEHPEEGLYSRLLSRVERSLVAAALKHRGGNQVQAASLLGITRNTLRAKMTRYGLDH